MCRTGDPRQYQAKLFLSEDGGREFHCLYEQVIRNASSAAKVIWPNASLTVETAAQVGGEGDGGIPLARKFDFPDIVEPGTVRSDCKENGNIPL